MEITTVMFLFAAFIYLVCWFLSGAILKFTFAVVRKAFSILLELIFGEKKEGTE